ncbi:MAG TPA: hypothetical protein VF247_04385 [Candidatus Krumholzibacteria bacterium]
MRLPSPIVVLALCLVCPGTAARAAGHWAPAVSAFLFDPPGDDVYVSPIASADRRSLHLEARYNYEDLDTGSLFAGRSFATGDRLIVTATPMLGVVIGNTDGVAPGLELDVSWNELEWYSELEWVFADDDFFYAWIEATVAPVSWLRVGIAGQRTRAYETGLDMQRGPMIDVPYGHWTVGAYWFNPDRDEDDLFVFAAGYEW